MKQSIKQRQVGTLIQREFSVVLRNEGPYIYGDVLVTVTRVRMSSDMGIAYIYVSVYDTLYKQEIIKELWENLSRLRGELGKRIRKQVRRIPMLKFFIDDTLDEVEHLDRLFEQMNGGGNSHLSMKEILDRQKEREKEDNAKEDEEQ